VQSSIEKAHHIFSSVVVGEEEEQRSRAVEVTFCCLQKEKVPPVRAQKKRRISKRHPNTKRERSHATYQGA